MSAKKKQKRDLPANAHPEPISRFPVFAERFRADLGWWYKNDRAKANKILDLVEAVMKDPFQGIGKPESLKFLDADTWSRRIDREHRLVYRVRQQRIDFLQARYHYDG